MKNLRKTLKKMGLKQRDLCDLTGASKAVVSHHARFGIKTIRVARRYAKVLGCSPFELLD